MRNKIDFAVNQPTPILLDFSPADTPVQKGTYGDDYRYVVNNDQGIVFARPELHALILQSGAQAGDEIYITRKQQGKQVTWEVQRVQEEPPQPRRQPPAPVNGHANGTPKPTPAASSPAPAAAAPASSADVLAAALVSAVEAAAVAEARARDRGMALRFTSEDVRALANTIVIGGRK